MNYYEVEFDDGYSMCILGERKPTVKQANEFCKKDCERMKTKIIDVQRINRSYAYESFDMEDEAIFPIFK